MDADESVQPVFAAILPGSAVVARIGLDPILPLWMPEF